MSKEPIKDNKSKEQMQTLEPCISHNADETNEILYLWLLGSRNHSAKYTLIKVLLMDGVK